jgi:aerobic-type carbon monoxide dehydrogenase small subunit (CoxS/CutS family)
LGGPREACLTFRLEINGIAHEVDVDGHVALLRVVRDALGVTGRTGASRPAVAAVHPPRRMRT